jgi:hypothetical protein
MPDVQDTAEYKLNKSGRKVRAHKIVFNKGEEESMRKPDVVNEVLSKDDPASKWISDFVKSDNPKFEGKSKKKRINMALGAYYAAKRGAVKEEVESLAEMIDRVRECALLDEAVEVSHDRYMRSHSKKASGTGTWMFTHKPMGSVDYKDESQVHSARGSFSDAKKSAQQWAKKNGHSRVYVMEENKTQNPYHAGYDAHEQKKTRQHNPYKEGSEGAAQWAKGWEHASDGKPRVKFTNEEVEGVTEARFVKAAGGVPSDRYGNPKVPTPPKSSLTASLNQLLKNKRENPGQSPFKTQDDKVKKYLGMHEELELDEAPYTGKGNHRPGWMLRADPELAAKLKKNIDAAKLRQKYMGKTADEIAKMKKG